MTPPKNPVGWFEIYVQDIERAKAFYESTFDTTLERLPTPVSEVELWAFRLESNAEGCSGALVRMDGFGSGGNSVIVYFAVDDCSVEEARARNAGGHIVKTKFSVGDYGYICLLTDTEGNMIGLHSHR